MGLSEGRAPGRRIRLKSAVKFIISTKRLRSHQSLREFVADGSTGLDRIAAIDPRQIFRRTVWSAVLVGLVAVTVYYVQEIIRERFHYGVASTVNLMDDGVVPFPAVSFCNLNPVRKSALCEKQEFQITQSYAEQRKLCGSVLSQDEFLESLNTLIANENNVTYDDLGHSLDGMLVECFIKGKPCNRTEITEVIELHGKYGRCFCVFCRTKKPVAFSRTDEPIEGFNMILRTEFEEYIPSTSAEGFMLLMHSPHEVPDDNANGIFVAPHRTTYIAIQPRRVFRLGAPYPSRCSDEWSVDKLPSWVDLRAISEEYTPLLCRQICQSDILNKKCEGCVVSGGEISLQLAMDATAFCARNMSCSGELLRRDANFDCNCPQRCTETVVHYEASMAAWTVQRGEDKHLVKVTIYFSTITRELVTEFPILSGISALTLVGGFLNMYVGLSFLSMFEFIEIALFIYTQNKIGLRSWMDKNLVEGLQSCLKSDNKDRGSPRKTSDDEEGSPSTSLVRDSRYVMSDNNITHPDFVKFPKTDCEQKEHSMSLKDPSGSQSEIYKSSETIVKPALEL